MYEEKLGIDVSNNVLSEACSKEMLFRTELKNYFKAISLFLYSKDKYMATYLYRKACANFKYYIFFIENQQLCAKCA